MKFGDPRKFQVILQLREEGRQWDVEEYLTRCKALDYTVFGTELEYAQKVGMIEYAIYRYPEKNPFEAYMLVAMGVNSLPDNIKPNCSSCGGGQVK